MNRKIKHIALVLIRISVLMSVCYAHGEREDKEELILKALDIFYGKVVDIQYRRLEEVPYEITEVKVEVIEQFKGEPKEEVVLKFEGGKRVIVGFQISLEEGDEAIFFTHRPTEEWLTTIYGESGLIVKDGMIKEYEMTLEQFRDYINEVLASDRAREISQREMNRRSCAVYESKDVVLAKVVHIGDARYVDGHLYTPVKLKVIERFKGDSQERELIVLALGGKTKTEHHSGIVSSFDTDREIIVHAAVGPKGYLFARKHASYVTDGLIPMYDITLSQFRDFIKQELSRDWAIENADFIVYAKVEDRQTGKYDNREIGTLISLEVLEQFKGNPEKQEIVLVLPGLSEERYPPLRPYIIGSELIVYTKVSEYNFHGTFMDPYLVIDGTIPDLNMSLAQFQEFVKGELAKCVNE